MPSRRKKSRFSVNTPIHTHSISHPPDLQSLLGESPYIYQRYGIDHAVEYLRQLVKQGAKNLPPLAERIAILGRVANKTDPRAALELAEKALELSDKSVEAWLLAGAVYDRLGRKSESTAALYRAIESDLATPDQKLSAASMLVRQGHHEIALAKAKVAFDALGSPLRVIPTLLHIAQRTADWNWVDELTDKLHKAYSEGKKNEVIEEPRDHLLWCSDEATNIQVTRQWYERVLPCPAEISMPVPNPLKGRRLRVGYLSSDFREHPTSRLLNGLLRNHDRSNFELFMYCSGWDDGSVLRKKIERQFDHIHAVAMLDDKTAAELIQSHSIDVLVELNGPTRANRMGILNYRPAPVQIGYLGFPGSVGGGVDYIIGDDYTVPEGREIFYPEKIIRIPYTYQVNDYAARPTLAKLSRAELEMPDGDVVILGMFNNIDKVNNEVWDAWMRILNAVPNALLWTLNHGQTALRNMALAAIARGVDPNRIIVGPSMKQDEHLARMQACDLMLDPWPYGGHTTTSDALFSGVPVITLEGTNFAGRVSGGLLRAAGLEDLIAPGIEAYIQKTTNLLRDPNELKKIKQHLRDTVINSPLFDAEGRTRNIETAYISAFERAENGLTPKHIRVNPLPKNKTIPYYQRVDTFIENQPGIVSRNDFHNETEIQKSKISRIQAYVISWSGQHENAIHIASKLNTVLNKVSIVYSDPDEDFVPNASCKLIKRSNELFWGDKFKACVDTCDAELLLIIRADCTCENWALLAKKCMIAFETNESIGVWAPKIENTPLNIVLTKVSEIKDTSLSVVTNTDGIVFCLSNPIKERMRKADYSNNIYGLGINSMFCAAAFVQNKLVVVDDSILVAHDPTSDYPNGNANRQKIDFLEQLSPTEKVQYRLSLIYSKVRKMVLSDSIT